MRKVLLILAAGMALAPAATAHAFVTVPSLSGALTPSKLGTAAHPTSVKLTLHVSHGTDPAGLQPNTVYNSVLTFPKAMRLNASSFPSCTEAKLDSSGPGACPAGSRVGSGNAVGTGGTPGQPPLLSEPLGITMFNGPS